MKKILGLDLGTNSIGWALVEINDEIKVVKILGLGSRILSMDAGEISTFESGGKLKSMAAERTTLRTARKLNERFLLRRDRLHCVLNLLKTLPEHYKVEIEFENVKGYRSGKLRKGSDIQLAYVKDVNGKSQFLFKDSYYQMVNEFRILNPELFRIKGNGKETKIPYDWTLYYLRKEALKREITKEELAWITLSFNQKRGYEKTIGQDEKAEKEGELSEVFVCEVITVKEFGIKNDLKIFEITLLDQNKKEIFKYKEDCKFQITQIGDLKELEIVSKYDENGDIDKDKVDYLIRELRKFKVTNVSNTNRKKNENFIFNIELETGWLKEQQSKYFPKWKDTYRDFVIKTTYDKNGNRVEKGIDKGRNLKSPDENDWNLLKLKTDTELSSYNAKSNTWGIASYIYSSLLKNPNQKIKGKLITVIERKYYRVELEKIFECQKEFHPELQNIELYKKAINILYPHNENQRKKLEGILYSEKTQTNAFSNLITNDIILYQRDLKSKKSLIADCAYEKYQYSVAGNEIIHPLKAIHKSNPLYQEFRIWQFIKRIKIIQIKGDHSGEINKDVTEEVLTNAIKIELFLFLNNREQVEQKDILKHLDLNELTHKWNFEKDHKEPCNETRYKFILRLKRIKNFDWKKFLSLDVEYRMWHFFYSVKKQEEFKTGLKTLFEKLLIDKQIDLKFKEDLIRNFNSFSGYPNDYGTYSEKAIKKLLPFMRLGRKWEDSIVELNNLQTRNENERINSREKNESVIAKYNNRIDQILIRVDSISDKDKINTVADDEVSKGTITSFWGFSKDEEMQGLALHQACYLVYNRHSEVGDLSYWETPYDIENFMRKEFKQHSLNNPVVEKVLIETLQVVKDIWMKFGEVIGNDESGRPIYGKLFDRIHIELGREMKKNEKERLKASKQNIENQKTNERIAHLLEELSRGNDEIRIKSPFQQEKLRIIEDDLLSSIEYDKESTTYPIENGNITKKEIKEITSKRITDIKQSDFERYKLWLDQRYQSPYTGLFIKLSDLFNREKYEIEHIFPQERITLDAQINKVICETEVNKIKKAKTGYQFIDESKGSTTIYCAAHRKEVSILKLNDYEYLVKNNFTDKRKQEILLSKDIPEKFTDSQLNNTKYIAKMAMKLLSNIVREKGEESFRSKNVLPINGTITTKLKRDWLLNDAWNEIIQPRFRRLNLLTSSSLFGEEKKINGHAVFINRVPEGLSKDFDKKRIDHRHHAMDALAIALVTENHVNYLNNISSIDNPDDKQSNRIAIKNKFTHKVAVLDENGKEIKIRRFLPPAQFNLDSKIVEYKYEYAGCSDKLFKKVALEALQQIVVSFKQKSRIMRQRTNYYQRWNDETGKIEITKQEKLKDKRNFNVRLAMHKDTYYRKIDDELVSTRFGNDLETLAAVKADKINQVIESVVDKGIQTILKNHLEKNNSNPELAFSSEGVDDLNKNIIALNNGRDHKPIYRVRMKDAMGTKFPVSDEGQKNKKFVVTAPGSNAFCGVYANEKGERKYIVPTLRDTIENLQSGNSACKEIIADGKPLEDFKLLFVLSPNDFVYVPEDNFRVKDVIDYNRIYKFTDGSGDTLNFVPYYVANPLVNLSKKEYNELKISGLKFKEELKNGVKTKDLVNEIGLGSPQSKNQNTVDGVQIKKNCLKLEVDRLGNISI